jgi:squalene cyclase
MGRIKKYKTIEEKLEAQRNWAKEYYYRNKEKINKKTMEKYYELRKNIQSDNKQIED